MQYRQEIDGLRAVAVVPVILYHAGFSVFGGGFIGVDVFFVISGYLITSLIQVELAAGSFSIIRFYERRARRILPALTVVMLSCIPCAWFLMLPEQFTEFSHSLIAVPLFFSNVLFWREAGYFETASEEKPLLHTWSLAVEEQYYLIFPLLMILLWRFGRKRAFYVVLFLAVISLLISEWGWRNKPSANFFLAPSRIWELLAGSLCAFLLVTRGQWSSNILSLAGLGSVVWGIFVFDARTPFPSLYTLAPVCGSALIILFAAPETWVARLLSLRIIVGIGLISYSAYLWHQPLFAFSRIASSSHPSQILMLFLAMLTFVLAWASWRFVEQPFRRRPHPLLPTRNALFAVSGIATGGVTLIGVLSAIFVTPHIVSHFPDAFAVFNKSPDSHVPCSGFQSQQGDAQCRRYGDGKRVVVLWGDSHVKPLQKVITTPDGVSLYVVSHHGCPPVMGVRRHDNLGNPDNCSKFGTLNVYADYIESLNPDDVILVGRWTVYMHGFQRRGVLQPATHFLAEKAGIEATARTSEIILNRALERTVESFTAAARRVMIVSQLPDMNHISDRQRVMQPEIPRYHIDFWHGLETEMFAGQRTATVIDSKKLFCSGNICRTHQDGYPLYSDDNHASKYGAWVQWQAIVAAIEAAI